MPLIAQSIPNLVGGISQQPPKMRRSNQCEDTLNSYSDPVSGLKKRPGSQHIATLTTTPGAYYGSIERDAVERYIYSLSPTGVKVWDDGGVERAVDTPDGIGYLAGTNTYRTLTIADTTFVVNPTTVVAMNPATTFDNSLVGFIFIRAVDFGVRYDIDIQGVAAAPASYTAPTSGTVSTVTAAESLRQSLDGNANITATRIGSVIRFVTTGPYTLEAYSSLGEDFIVPIPGTVQNFSDLPEIGFANSVVRVTQNPSTSVDDYFVKYVDSGNSEWVETIGPNTEFEIDATTMPHVLISNADGTFTFRQFDWADRVVGDAESNPNPSFIGQRINNLMFERNRLGFLSDVNCILSESNNVSNFWRTTVSTIIDSDPIDLAASGRQVDILKTSIGVRDGILMFSESNQFLLNVGDADILSPETASITNISAYQSNTDVEPVRVGDSILFLTRRDEKTGVREYFYQSNRDFTQSASITNHIPSLLPSSLDVITGSSTENIVFLTGSEGSLAYVYQFLYRGEEKIVSSWTKWNFAGATVEFSIVFDDYLFVILNTGSAVTLERIPLSNSFVQQPLDGEVCLDQISLSTSITPSVGVNTVFTFPYLFRRTPVVILLGDRVADGNFTGDVVTPLSIVENLGETDVTFAGDWSTQQFLIGSPYDFFFEFSTPFITLDNGDVEIGGRLQIRNVDICLNDTGDADFRLFYEDESFSSQTTFISDITDWSDITDMLTLTTLSEDVSQTVVYPMSRAFPEQNLAEKYNLIDYTYRVPVNSQNTRYRLRIESNSFQPVNISKAKWEALYHLRSRSV